MEQVLNPMPGKPANRFRNSTLAQAWLVLILAMAFGSALAAVEVNLSGIIAANKLNETLEKIPELVPGPVPSSPTSSVAASFKVTPGTVTIAAGGKTKVYAVYRATRQGQPAGWVIKAGGQGYADKIDLLVGIDPRAEAITGLFILEQKETPGLGNKITFAGWRNQFIGKKTDEPLQIIKGSGTAPDTYTIDAITGATISSRAVTAIVNKTIGDMKNRLAPSSHQFMERLE